MLCSQIPSVRAIVCARGGAGTAHLLPGLDRGLVRADPKLVVGYSDVTALHLVLGQLGITSLHGPMVALGAGGRRARVRQRRASGTA